jgi:hypothetical protein
MFLIKGKYKNLIIHEFLTEHRLYRKNYIIF